MRPATFFVAALCLLAGAPALATSTLECTVPGRTDLRLSISVSNSAGIAQARLVDRGQETVTGHEPGQARITQNWVDPLELKLDVTDANVENRIIRVEARRSVDRGPYLGTLSYRERRMRVSCQWDEDEG